MMRIFIVVMAVVLACLHLSYAGDSDEFAKCILDDSRPSAVKKLLQIMEGVTSLEFWVVPKDPKVFCGPFLKAVKVDCPIDFAEYLPRHAELPWQDRWSDTSYIEFLSKYAYDGCKNDLSLIRELKDCYSSGLRNALRFCLNQTGYMAECLINNYRGSERCPGHVDDFFENVLVQKFYASNPYYRY